MAQYLDPDQPFYALQPHGFDGGKIPGTIEAMAASYLDTVQGVQPEGPYLLGGVCNGGIIAFEMARQLEARGHVVALVVLVVAVQAPLWARVARVVVGVLGSLMGLALERQVDHYGQLCYYVERLGIHARAGLAAQIGVVRRVMGRGIKGMTQLGQAAWRGALLAGDGAPDLGADNPSPYSWGTYRWAIAGYRPRRFAGRITLLWPRDQRADFARTVRWRAVSGEVERHFVPGTHDTCTESQNIPALAAEIQACLTRAHRA
jgi:thioesterase domain-containing protein